LKNEAKPLHIKTGLLLEEEKNPKGGVLES